MIQPSHFYNLLKSNGINLFTGVPDSLLSSLCAYIDDHTDEVKHIITANEGNAIALAAGHYLSTAKFSAVYMQNSGLGNSINPLTSLTDPEVYRIPMLLIIGWRGEPNTKDEPQHVKQGRITAAQLELLEIPYFILDAGSNVTKVITQAFRTINEIQAPVALLVRKNSFAPYKSIKGERHISQLTREEALRETLSLSEDDIIISTTGKTSREIFDLRIEMGESQRDFLTVGSMGHTASIALGVALGAPHKRIICIDGDGSLLMHMGALAIIGSNKPKNFIHILLNNAAHDSVGGQPTVANTVNFASISQACGYRKYAKVNNISDLKNEILNFKNSEGPSMLEISIKLGSRENLGRPSSNPEENKISFTKFIRT